MYRFLKINKKELYPVVTVDAFKIWMVSLPFSKKYSALERTSMATRWSVTTSVAFLLYPSIALKRMIIDVMIRIIGFADVKSRSPVIFASIRSPGAIHGYSPDAVASV